MFGHQPPPLLPLWLEAQTCWPAIHTQSLQSGPRDQPWPQASQGPQSGRQAFPAGLASSAQQTLRVSGDENREV